MAPEQASGHGKELGPAVDVYAFGAILYEALSSRPPFKAATPLKTLQQVAWVEPVAPSRLQPKVPRDLNTICLKCLGKEPLKRYASAQALAEDLRRFLEGQPIQARPIYHLERLGRWCRRNPLLAGLVTSVALLLVVLAVGALLAAKWMSEERNLAVANEQAAQDARQEATQKLRESYLAQARAGRWSGRAGRRFGGLRVLSLATAIGPSLELRNEAIACMALPDLEVAQQWSLPSTTTYTAFAADLKRFARGDRQGNIVVRRLRDGRDLVRLPGFGAPVRLLAFSPNDRLLAARYEGDTLRVWHLSRHRAILSVPKGLANYAFAFSPDSRLAAAARLEDEKAAIVLYDLTSGQEPRRLGPSPVVHSLAFHPDGRRLVASSLQTTTVQVWDTVTKKVVSSLAHPTAVRGMAWSDDGALLATACANARVYVWRDGKCPPRTPAAVLEGHHGVVFGVAFNHAGPGGRPARPDGVFARQQVDGHLPFAQRDPPD
jgi:hypothetical protein